MTALDGTIKSTFHGNRLLMTATLGENGKFTNVEHHLGLVSVDAFENKSEAENQYADNETWPVASATQVMQGSISLIQMDDKLRTDFFGQQEVTSKLGSATITGYADTGIYPQRALMYVTDGIAKDGSGNATKSLLITFLPNAECISTPQKETETDTDGISVVNWTADIQATATPKFTIDGRSQAIYEYQIVGDEQVNAALSAILANNMPMPPTVSA